MCFEPPMRWTTSIFWGLKTPGKRICGHHQEFRWQQTGVKLILIEKTRRNRCTSRLQLALRSPLPRLYVAWAFCTMWVRLNISYMCLKNSDDELQEHPIFLPQRLIVLSNSGCWPRSEHNDNLWELIMYSCIGNAKFEIYKETKITAEEKLMKISVFKEKKKRNTFGLCY